ncbi:MAG TPA: hypothetical protein VI894_00185 [Candidatus Nanoarchaeia archaeon]|nr:hypothetical protein [Candidatus Nanoarchaeia archaeon]
MAEQSTFGNILVFFKEIGIYDVVLPFLLVFTIIFAILEKTKVFGTEKVGAEVYTKKNLNAMTAFVVSFLVIASTKLVAIINEAIANTVLLLMLSVFFLLLVGSFRKEGEVALEGSWEKLFMVLMFVGILLIFLNAIKLDSSNQYCGSAAQGECSFLSVVWNYVAQNWNSRAVGSIILVLIVIFFMWIVTKEPQKRTEKKES